MAYALAVLGEGTTHDGQIRSLLALPDGRWVSYDGRIRLWDPAGTEVASVEPDAVSAIIGWVDGALLWQDMDARLFAWDGETTYPVEGGLGERAEWLNAIVRSGDHRTVALLLDDEQPDDVGGPSSQIRVWNRDAGVLGAFRPPTRPGCDPYVTGLALSPDGRRLFVKTRHGFTIWEVSTGHALCSVAFDEEIHTFHTDGAQLFSPDGERLWLHAEDWGRLYSATTGAQLGSVDAAQIARALGVDDPDADLGEYRPECSAFLDDATLVSSGSRAMVRIDVKAMEIERAVAHPQRRMPLSIAVAGATIALADDQSLLLYDAETLHLRNRKGGHSSPIRSAAISPDGIHIVSLCDRSLILWSSAGEQLWERDSGDGIFTVCFAPDSGSFIGPGPEGVSRHGLDGRVQECWPFEELHCSTVSWPGEGGPLFVEYEQDTRMGLRGGPFFKHRCTRGPHALSMNGRVLFGPSEGMSFWRVWDVRTQAVIASGRDWVSDVSMSADGAFVAVAAAGICWLDTATGKKQRLLEDVAVLTVAVSPDGSQMAYFDERDLWVRAAPSAGAQRKDARKPMRLGGPEKVTFLAFDTTGERLLAGYESGGLIVWDTAPEA